MSAGPEALVFNGASIITLACILAGFIALRSKKYLSFLYLNIISLLTLQIHYVYKLSIIIPIAYLLFVLLSIDSFKTVKDTSLFISDKMALSLFLGSIPHVLIITFAGLTGSIFFKSTSYLSIISLFATSGIEELFFRTTLPREYDRFSLVIVSFLYSLFHIPLIATSIPEVLLVLVAYTLFGISLQIVYNQYGLLCSYIFHLSYNLIAVHYLVSMNNLSMLILLLSHVYLVSLLARICQVNLDGISFVERIL